MLQRISSNADPYLLSATSLKEELTLVHDPLKKYMDNLEHISIKSVGIQFYNGGYQASALLIHPLLVWSDLS